MRAIGDDDDDVTAPSVPSCLHRVLWLAVLALSLVLNFMMRQLAGEGMRELPKECQMTNSISLDSSAAKTIATNRFLRHGLA